MALRNKAPAATITAAARPLNIRNASEAATISAVTRTKEQRDAWRFYGSRSELNYPTNYLGRNVGRFRFPVGVIPEDDLTAPPLVPAKDKRDDLYRLADEIMFGVRGEDATMSDLADSYTKNMAVAGECWLVGRTVSGEMLWTVFSVEEFGPKNNGATWEQSTNPGTAYARYSTGNPAKPDESWKFGFVRRLWQPSPRLREYADTTTFAVLDDLRMLEALDRSLRARIINTLTQAGFLFVPSGFSLAGPVGAPKGDGKVVDDPFAAKLIDIIQRQHDSGDASALPALIRGEGSLGEAIRFITMDRTIDHVELELRAERRSAIAKGMFLPPEVIEGMGSANHWSSWSVADSAFSHLLPYAQGWANTLTTMILWPLLRDGARARGIEHTETDIRRHVVTPDGSAVISRPNEAEDGRQLHDRLSISDRALRERTNATEEEAPTDEEAVRMLGRKINNPYLATYGLPIHTSIDWDAVAAVGQSEGRPGVGSVDEGHRPADSSDPVDEPESDEDEMSARLLAAATPGYLLAARKKIGAKVRGRCEPNKDLHASIRQLPNEGVLSGVDLAEVGLTSDEVAGWFLNELTPIIRAVPDAEPQAVLRFVRAVARRAVEGDLDEGELASLAIAATLPREG